MEFMELLQEWPNLRDYLNKEGEDCRPINERGHARDRMNVLEYELNHFFITKQS